MISAPPSSGNKSSSTPNKVDWECLDLELRCMLSPISDMLNSNSIFTSDAANSFSTIVHTHLHNAGLIHNCIYNNCHHIKHRDNQFKMHQQEDKSRLLGRIHGCLQNLHVQMTLIRLLLHFHHQLLGISFLTPFPVVTPSIRHCQVGFVIVCHRHLYQRSLMILR